MTKVPIGKPLTKNQLLGPVGEPMLSQTVKNPPAIQETWVRSLGGEDPLEEGMATHSSILAWRILWTEKPGGLQSLRVTKNGTQLSE